MLLLAEMDVELLLLFFLLNLVFEHVRSERDIIKVAAMHRKGVVFSKMFVLRSMGNELVPSPLYLGIARIYYRNYA